jgi:pimeloyl-ACP methyl ester carboxylesterase
LLDHQRISPGAWVAENPDVLYFHDVPDQVIAEAYGRGQPDQSLTPMTQPWPLEAWPHVPTCTLVGSDDPLLPAPFQRHLARECLRIEAEKIAGGHYIALNSPQEIADRPIR